MAKKKKKNSTTSKQAMGFGVKNLSPELQKADALLVRRKWEEAQEVLESLSRSYPQNTDILSRLINVNYELQDMPAYQHACERYVKVDPKAADVQFELAGAYVMSERYILALQAFQRALARWPHHQRAEEASRLVEELQAPVQEVLDHPALTALDKQARIEVGAFHEQGQVYLDLGEYDLAGQAAAKVLQQAPSFLPARNNLSLVNWLQGNLEDAITLAQEVLQQDPNNIHALANLIHFHCLRGEIELAQSYVPQLKASPVQIWDHWTKKAEALSYLGNHADILELYQQFQETGHSEANKAGAIFYHLVAVAMDREGQEQEAVNLWEKALECSPSYALAAKNLADQDLPISERHGSWPFTFREWLSSSLFHEIVEVVQEKAEEDLQGQMRAYLDQHPPLAHLVPLLLERGDPQGRHFALLLAKMVATPAMLQCLKTFALSQRGPDQMRMEAMELVAEADLWPDESIRMWLRGQWQEIRPLAIKLHDETQGQHSAKVTQLCEQALELLRYGEEEDGVEAERLLRQALKLEPEAPDLSYNLAAAYELQGRQQEANQQIREVAARFPEYLFGKLGLAVLHVQAEEFEAAEAILKPFLSYRRLHFSEFAALSQTYLQLLFAQKRLDAAQSWLSMWERADPDHPAQENWRMRLLMAR
ncbi:MAG: tetratricopeptide repeat protein [Synechococcaceae cyanobacterium SM2_3_1]|nr:tetratricopeptide repeat protein [Synechococcaceae cyanobacterium SM2_3_1]